MSIFEIILLIIIGVFTGYGLSRLKYPLSWAITTPLVCVILYGLMRVAGGMTLPQSAASVVFIFCYALIISERIHRTNVALIGAAAVLLFRLVEQHSAFHGHEQVAGVDWNTIFLLAGMMIVVNEMRHTGVFEWVAIKCAKLAKGEPIFIIIYLSIATAVLSAFLDNVTTVLLFIPVTVLVCNALKTDAVPYLIAIVIASNIGGTATLIGDPPNIMIGSAADLSFADFIKINSPITVVVLFSFLFTWWLMLRKRMRVSPEQKKAILAFNEAKAITNYPLLRRTGLVMGLILVGFCVHGAFHIEPATIALMGAAILLVLRKGDPEHSLREVEWNTLFFYIGLFVMVAALVEVGVVNIIARGVIELTGGEVSGHLPHAQKVALTIGLLWFSAITAAVLGNVALIPVMTAIITDIAVAVTPVGGDVTLIQALHSPDIIPLWWALSLGACFGGNFTMVAAGANVVTAGLAEKAKQPIGFVRFLKYGVPITLQSLLLTTVYLWILFLR